MTLIPNLDTSNVSKDSTWQHFTHGVSGLGVSDFPGSSALEILQEKNHALLRDLQLLCCVQSVSFPPNISIDLLERASAISASIASTIQTLEDYSQYVSTVFQSLTDSQKTLVTNTFGSTKIAIGLPAFNGDGSNRG